MQWRRYPADPIESAVLGFIGGPDGHTAGIKIARGGMEAAPHDARGEIAHGHGHGGPLRGIGLVLQDQVHAAHAVTDVDEFALQRRPGLRRQTHEFAGGAVELIGEPDERLLHGAIARVLRRAIGPHVAVESTLANEVDAVLRRPMAFLVGDIEAAVIINAHAVRGAETIGDNLGSAAVFFHA